MPTNIWLLCEKALNLLLAFLKVMDSLLCCICFHWICLLFSLSSKSMQSQFSGHESKSILRNFNIWWFCDFQEYSYISSKRVSYFYSSKPQPHQFTLLVRGVPGSSRNSFSEVVESFFKEYHPSTYLSHTVIRRTSRIQELTVSIQSELLIDLSCLLGYEIYFKSLIVHF